MTILFVDDNEAEQLIMREALKTVAAGYDLFSINNGTDAIDFLRRRGKYQGAVRPDIIVLDLSLPRKSGMELLVDIKETPAVAHVPILVFSNSESPHDICRCYELRVNAYVSKPADFQGYLDLATVIDRFWLKQVRYCLH